MGELDSAASAVEARNDGEHGDGKQPADAGDRIVHARRDAGVVDVGGREHGRRKRRHRRCQPQPERDDAGQDARHVLRPRADSGQQEQSRARYQRPDGHRDAGADSLGKGAGARRKHEHERGDGQRRRSRGGGRIAE